MHPPQDSGGAHPLGYALEARVHQSEQAALVSRLGRHNGALGPAVYEGCHLVAVDLQEGEGAELM